MGVTYKAIDTVLNRPVALKVIAGQLLQSPQAKHRFLREAQAAALIHHPHVATIFQFGEEQDAHFYVMEFVEGEDLERYIARQGPVSPATTLRVALQIAQALEAAQARQLIHRDIKPSNIMAIVNRSGTLDVKLIDFGLARGAGAETLDAAKITRQHRDTSSTNQQFGLSIGGAACRPASRGTGFRASSKTKDTRWDNPWGTLHCRARDCRRDSLSGS